MERDRSGRQGLIFWCWRDEVFGPESSGFGLIGDDGCADERLAALKASGDVLARHSDLLDAYAPDPAKVGSCSKSAPITSTGRSTGDLRQAGESVVNYLRALERAQVPYDVLDSEHLEGLDGLRLLFMPWPLVVVPAAADGSRSGSSGAGPLWSSRSSAHMTSAVSTITRPSAIWLNASVSVLSGGEQSNSPVCGPSRSRFYSLGPATWVEAFDPGDGVALAKSVTRSSPHGQAGKWHRDLDRTFLGLAYSRERNHQFEDFLRLIADDSGALSEMVSSDWTATICMRLAAPTPNGCCS